MEFLSRYQWENDFQWKARQLFIQTHEGKFDVVRLASLSNAWSNWRFHGCAYCFTVQSMLTELDKELPCELHMAMKEIPSHAKLNEVKFQKSSLQFTAPTRKEFIPGLTLYIPKDEAVSNPISILTESTQKSKKYIEFNDLGFKEGETNEPVHETSVFIGERLVAVGIGINRKESKRACADRALEILKQCQPSCVKQLPNHNDLRSIEKGDLVKAAFKNANRIDESNVGNILLRKMGWSGEGGLAKNGISDPVFLESADGRKGLGHAADDVTIERSSIEEKLTDFIQHSAENDLKFSSKLSKNERALVHKLCTKYGLKHKSFGKGDERYLVVSKG